ncbi:MAG TPA: neutral zinc metallopeptidase [Candidatus Eisenbacteria bacterium]|nr:neutral zinc metallopeptidase [Candidatus Eisenbacteria bacterium]
MRWRPGGRSADLEDRRGEDDGGGGGPRFPGGIRIGLGGIVVLLVLSVITGQNFLSILDPGMTGGGGYDDAQQQAPRPSSPEDEEQVQFVSFVLDDAQSTWNRVLPAAGRPYRNAKLVLFTNGVRSGCGFGETAMGPFYCPVDEKVYIDLAFYQELKRRFGAPGDFAQAYVIAHELGHHVQKVLGISDRVRQFQESNPSQANAISVRMELQADCLAGVWGHSTNERNILEQGDAEEALNAASAIGDDRIQKSATGTVNPETWTHGSSAQRVAWFKRGLSSGRIDDCDTFSDRLPSER